MELIDVILVVTVLLTIYKMYTSRSTANSNKGLLIVRKFRTNVVYYVKLFANDVILLILFILGWRGWEKLMQYVYTNKSSEQLDVTPIYNFEDISIIIFGLYGAFLVVRFSMIFTQLINKSFADYIEHFFAKDFLELSPWKKGIFVSAFIFLYSLVASAVMSAL